MATKRGYGLRPAAIISLFLFCVMRTTAANAQTTDETVRIYAGSWFHGIHSISDSVRLRIAPNRAVTDAIDDMLSGRRAAPPELDTAVAVWWLSESGRPEYLPALLRFSDHPNSDVATSAIYGLTRQLDSEAVRLRLTELDASGSREVRNNIAVLLTRANSPHARTLLAGMNRRGLSNRAIQRIERVLRAPPGAPGGVRYPCLESEKQERKPGCTQ